MSIGRRLIDLARAELNSLLERAARSEDDHDHYGFGSTDVLSDEELEAELERRKRAREEVEQATHGTRPGARPSSAASSSGRAGGRPAPRRASDDAAVRQAYAALEVPPGSDFETVRKAYRMLMRKYHPDLHNDRPENQKAANELTQRLTDSYKLLEKKLRR
ncbi:MAG TPA: J domain-containing protein [Polyangia bacterium]|nr:J domain-containing protein [Polyangia bacterium]